MPKSTVRMKIASVSCNQTGRDWPNNLKNIKEAIDRAVLDGADMLCFEELTLTGYDCGDDFQSSDNQVTQEHLQLIANYAASQNPYLVISIGHPWRFSDKTITGFERRNNPIFNRLNLPFNVQSFISAGQIIAMSAKRYLFSYERGYESRYFAEWSETAANQYPKGRDGTILIDLDGKQIPFGAPVIQIGGVNVTHAICEELWVGSKYDNSSTDENYVRDNPIAEKLEKFDINLVISPNASPSGEDKIDKVRHLVRLNSSLVRGENGKEMITVYTDGLGSSGSTLSQAGTRLMAKDGHIISEGPRWSFANIAYTSQVVDVCIAEHGSAPVHAIIEHPFSTEHTPGVNNQPAAWEYAAVSTDVEAFLKIRRLNDELRSELVWLFDYLRKSNLRGFTQALSGGADSAYNAVKVRLMIELVINECGLLFFLDALDYPEDERQALLHISPRENLFEAIMKNMLTCVYLGTPNNSEDTKRAAMTLINGGQREDKSTFNGIGGQFYFYNIQPLVDLLALLYTGVDLDQIPAEQFHMALNTSRAFLSTTSDLDLSFKVEAFKAQLRAITQRVDGCQGPVLTPANPLHGVTIENMQARIRQVIIMMITNFEPLKIGIANPNLDEICNAYTTFGGDEHAGQIALNAHKPKDLQLEHMRQLMNGEFQGAAPVKALYWVLKNKASAELKPMEEGVVVQYDEDALGRTFPQAQEISLAMLTGDGKATSQGRNRSPIEVFETCLAHSAFANDSLDVVHDKVLLSYINWKFAQHKIHAFPIHMTYGRNVDHQTSRRTPNLGACHLPELAQLSLHCLAKMAEIKGHSFEGLTGYALQACLERASIDETFQKALRSAMWTPNATDGRKRKITTLYKKLAEKELNIGRFFDGSTQSWANTFFDRSGAWKERKAVEEDAIQRMEPK